MPFLASGSFLAIPSAWIRTKEYMTPTQVDKAAGKRRGYVPDYSIWRSGLPLMIVEAKAPDVDVAVGLREARLYASEINKRYPPGVNPISYVLACNGVHLALSSWDSETDTVSAPIVDAMPGTQVFDIFQETIGYRALEKYADKIASHFETRQFSRASAYLGGQDALNRLLGVNEFAEPLYPLLARYFASTTEEIPDEVIDKAYVSTDEVGQYEGILNTYLKERVATKLGSQIKPIETSRTSAGAISTELSKFTVNPAFYSRVQLVIGSVGAGKSTFMRRFYRRLMAPEVSAKTRWAFIDFNPESDRATLRKWICEQFLNSFSQLNGIDIHESEFLEKIFAPEVKIYERGPAKALKVVDNVSFVRGRVNALQTLDADPERKVQAISRHFSGERRLGIVIAFDNVDKRSRDVQLAIFEEAQRFKELTRGLVLVNLRDSTFEAHRDEPPLDAFSNAINFYIRPPRFAQVIRKRLELVFGFLADEAEATQTYTTEGGYRIIYPSSRLGEYLLSIYLSLFSRRTGQIGTMLEALVSKDVRRALGMFGDVLLSPHVPTGALTGAALSQGELQLPEHIMIRALMRGRYRLFGGNSVYIRDILSANMSHVRPSNFLCVDVLSYLVRNRKTRLDFNHEGYATASTVIKVMSSLGYDEEDTLESIKRLAQWGLIEQDSLAAYDVQLEDAIRAHASGFAHLKVLLTKSEYLVGVSPNLTFSSREVAERIGGIWASTSDRRDVSLRSKIDIMRTMRDYFRLEYERRCRRHPFYEDDGFGGRAVVAALEIATEGLERARAGPRRETML